MMRESMSTHPCSTVHTARLLAMAELKPCRILDMGAGRGATVAFLRALGYDAVGVDRVPFAEVELADFHACPFPDESFDAVITECSFYVSGDEAGAIREASRLLKPHGAMLRADVCFGDIGDWRDLCGADGLRLVGYSDATSDWKRFFATCVWNGAVMPSVDGRGGCRYFLAVFLKDGSPGLGRC